MKLAERLTICEVGLRDGLQIEKTILTLEQKLELIHRLEESTVYKGLHRVTV